MIGNQAFIEKVDRVLFELCGQPMLHDGERRWVRVRKTQFGGVPGAAALAVCEERDKRQRREDREQRTLLEATA